MSAGDFHPVSWMAGMTDDEGAARAHSFFADMRGIREFEEEYEKYGPLMFGFSDGQSEAPKVGFTNDPSTTYNFYTLDHGPEGERVLLGQQGD